MSTQTSPAANALCARNLPQHFNGCACVADGSVTAEADVWLDISPDLPADDNFEPETPTVRVHGEDYEVIHLGGDTFQVDVNGTRVTFEEDPGNDDRVEEAAMLAIDSHLNRAWGNMSHIKEGSRTPWGAAQTVSRPLPGIVVVSTAGHGGVKVSPERNAQITAALRRKSGWYEEDCESTIVGLYFPDTFPHYRGADVADEDQSEWRRNAFEASVKSNFPDEYTKATGKPVALEESWTLRDRAARADKQAFLDAHSHEFVGSSGDTHAEWIPSGYAAVRAKMADTGEERHFLVPRDQVIHNGMWGTPTVIDPKRALDVTDVVNAKPEGRFPSHRDSVAPLRGEDMGIAYDGLTSAQASRARAELDKVWRFANDDGTTTTESLAQHMSRMGVVGKHPYVDGDKVTYSVEYPGSRVTKVSKATYDALTGVPDTSTPTQKAYVAKERARVVHERERDKMDFTTEGGARRAKVETAYRVAAAEYKRVSDEESEANRAWQAESTRLKQETFDRLVAERGISFD
jgi:hypothetical protein